MTDDRGATYATRGAQMFLRFSDEELARLSRFGEPRSYKAGDMSDDSNVTAMIPPSRSAITRRSINSKS